ncbi:MAG TPA: hypothetical protein VMT55_03655 [Candidatus Sulfotelmatobacter sp.]|nr:hypothetical protein [Candidatus Sulfotelmatobacter sp.]
MTENNDSSAAADGKKGNGQYPAIIGAILIIIVAGLIYEAATSSKKMTKNTPTASPRTRVYEDGTYTAEGDYMTHVGQKHISVTVTLKNDLITDADVKNEADDPMSVHYQDSFISGYKQYVIGKDISTIHLTKVGRSSLTPGGFNSALKIIESKAKS